MRQNERVPISNSILWGVVISLFILNLALLYALNLARLTAIEALSKAEVTLDKLSEEVVVYDVQINQGVPLKADVPFNQQMDIPIKAVIPIDQEMNLPFKTPAGEIMLNVPIKADFPIDTIVPLDFNQTIKVDTVVQLDTTVPVEIAVSKTPLASYLEQAKLDVVRLRNRLSFQSEAAAAEKTDTLNSTAGYDETANNIPITESAPQSKADEAAAATSADNLVIKADLGLCEHPYWPVQSGSTWTYNSPDTSYLERVETVSTEQVVVTTRYEEQDIQFNVACQPEGLGGSYLGDMRRIVELGDLQFNNPRGVFLPQPELMESAGTSWTQGFDINGTVNANQGEQPVIGKIARGQAEAVYTSTGFETVETPTGPQKAVRIEQKLKFELNIDFNIADQTIPAVETINLTNVYWFAKDMGLVKLHWQGGQIQREVTSPQVSVNRTDPVPALAEDKLVFICLSSEQSTASCNQTANLTEPPTAELNLPNFELPVGIGTAETVSMDEADAGTLGGEFNNNNTGQSGNPENAGSPVTPTDQAPDLLTPYGKTVTSLSQQMSSAVEEFGAAAMAYGNGTLSREDFQAEFSDFAPKTRQLVSQISNLTPPPAAQPVHQKLVKGLAGCTKALDLLEQWFDQPDSGAKETGIVLVTNCMANVAEAQNDLDNLLEAQ